MKIDEHISQTKPGGAGEAGQVKPEKQPPQTPEQQPAGGGDKVQLSPRSREIVRARETADAAPDVRAEKVAELKARIESGDYKVDSGEVAAKMLTEALSDKL